MSEFVGRNPESQREPAALADAEAPTEGKCSGPSAVRYWAPIGWALLMPQMLYLAFLFAASTNTEASGLLDRLLPSATDAVVASIFLGLLIWLLRRHYARWVRWDSHGIEIAYYYGEPRAYRWEDLRALKVDRFDTGPNSSGGTSLWVAAADGLGYRIGSSSDNYAALAKVLMTQIWDHAD